MMDEFDRTSELLAELKAEEQHHRLSAIRLRTIKIGALLLEVAGVATTLIYGFLPNHTSRTTALLALIPTGVAALAGYFRLEQRASWHRVMWAQISQLITRIKIEGAPLQPEQLVAISQRIQEIQYQGQATWSYAQALDFEREDRGGGPGH
jgi:hypothetical protein